MKGLKMATTTNKLISLELYRKVNKQSLLISTMRNFHSYYELFVLLPCIEASADEINDLRNKLQQKFWHLVASAKTNPNCMVKLYNNFSDAISSPSRMFVYEGEIYKSLSKIEVASTAFSFFTSGKTRKKISLCTYDIFTFPILKSKNQIDISLQEQLLCKIHDSMLLPDLICYNLEINSSLALL